MKHFKITVKETNGYIVTPEYMGDDDVDEEFLIKFFGLEEPDVVWYKIEEVDD